MTRPPRILGYVKRNLHLPHIEPILHALIEQRPDVDLRISAPPYQPSTERTPGRGISASEQQTAVGRGLRWIDEDQLADWEPDATLMADADFNGLAWGGKLVNVNHGLISKGWYYTRSAGVQRENSADLICVPGPYHAEVLREVLSTTVVATGLVKFDPVGRGELTRESARRLYSLPRDAHVVTFAPTFNPELSGVPVLAERVRELVRPDRHVLVKLHGMAADSWAELYRLLARLEERVHYVDGGDLTPALVAADVVISDVSSAFMEAIALDRPTVLIDNPLQTRYANYDPNDIEYRWRDVGLRARTADEVFAAVDRCFANPTELAAIRAPRGHAMVGEIDGHASDRAALAILELLGARRSEPLPHSVSVPSR